MLTIGTKVKYHSIDGIYNPWIYLIVVEVVARAAYFARQESYSTEVVLGLSLAAVDKRIAAGRLIIAGQNPEQQAAHRKYFERYEILKRKRGHINRLGKTELKAQVGREINALFAEWREAVDVPVF